MAEEKPAVIDVEKLGAALGKALIDANPEVQERLADKARRKEARIQLRSEVEKSRQDKLRLQMQCTHRKENGKYATNGQTLADGRIIILCTHCRYEWYLKPSPENLRLIQSGDLTLAEIEPPPIEHPKLTAAAL